jgi:hypothetical protein
MVLPIIGVAVRQMLSRINPAAHIRLRDSEYSESG